MFVVAERDQVKRAFGRLFACQPVETAFAEGFIDRANPVGPFRVSWRRLMIEAGRMAEEECHAGSWRG
jgi:hypothetical protein